MSENIKKVYETNKKQINKKNANKQRCKWVDLKSDLYIKYHDEEWGVPSYNDKYLFEMLILESFQAGLSWITILNKRECFREALDDFDVEKISKYKDEKIKELLENKNIIRNKLKIKATIENSKIFLKIQKEFGTFANYIWSWTNGKVVKSDGKNLKTTSNLSDKISKDLYSRGMRFVGTTIIYSYLQAIGIIDDHELECYKY